MPLSMLPPLADAFHAGSLIYAPFNCLEPFEDSERRFWDSTMRHLEVCQLDPLAIDPDIKKKCGLEVYASACVAFNQLERIRNAKRRLQEQQNTPKTKGAQIIEAIPNWFRGFGE